MTLTETATFTKRFLRVALVLGGSFLGLWLVFLFIYNNFIIPYQKSISRPAKRFGALPPPLPSSKLSSASLTYSLDTPSGFLPTNLPRLVNVYFITPQQTTLLAPNRARELAASLGFPIGPDILSPTNYKFSDQNGGSLTIDLSSSNFVFQRPLKADSNSSQVNILPESDTLISGFRDYLNQKNLLKIDLQKSPGQVNYNSDRSLATQATISLWQDNIDNLPIVTADSDHGLIETTVSKYSDESSKYLSLKYSYWPIDNQTFSTYQVKTVSQAFDELKRGLGTILKEEPADKISITKVYLAYFMSDQYAPYLQPIYVFSGPQFSAYLRALTDDSYTSQ